MGHLLLCVSFYVCDNKMIVLIHSNPNSPVVRYCVRSLIVLIVVAVVTIVTIVLICAIASRCKGVSISLHVSHTALILLIITASPHKVITGGEYLHRAIYTVSPFKHIVECVTGMGLTLDEVTIVPESVGRFFVFHYYNIPHNRGFVKRQFVTPCGEALDFNQLAIPLA